MIDMLLTALILLAALGGALVAGIFFAFSVFVMKALGRLPASQGMAAMQSINVAVLNPWFFAAFFGTAAVCMILAVLSVIGWDGTRSPYPLAGAVFYLFGCILVTMVFNVPLNTALAAAKPDADGEALWRRYLSLWTRWNHVRTAASLLAAAAFVMALR